MPIIAIIVTITNACTTDFRDIRYHPAIQPASQPASQPIAPFDTSSTMSAHVRHVSVPFLMALGSANYYLGRLRFSSMARQGEVRSGRNGRGEGMKGNERIGTEWVGMMIN
jgi:hypothetical protein